MPRFGNFISCSIIYDLLLGVLTKPDRIPSGETGNWLSFIRNEKEQLANGWYAVKQPGSQAIEQGITWEQAREQEDIFFATESGWCDLDPIYKKYLRTSNLVSRLSEILSDLISKRFFFQSSSCSDLAYLFNDRSCADFPKYRVN